MDKQKLHKEYIPAWKDAMHFGLMGGRPFSEISIKTYSSYAEWFLGQYGEVSIENLKAVLKTIPIEHFAKRYKLYQSLISLAKFLEQEKIIDETYLIEARKYKPKRHLPPKKRTVDQTSLEALMTACQTPLETLIVVLLSQTGLRVSEAAFLKLEDIDLEKQILTVRLAKWGKTRRVGFSGRVQLAIEAYLSSRPSKTQSPYLFLNSKLQPMDRFGIRIRLDKIGERAQVKVTPHALRRAFVTLNANKGRPLVMLQIACGHSSITTTRSYCLTTEDETIEAMRSWDN